MGKRNKKQAYEPFELDIDRMHIDGQGLGTLPTGRRVLVWGALPGERVLVMPRKRRKGFLHAELLDVLKPSPDRIAPFESHYISCSPWQVIAPEAEAGYKTELAREIFRERGGVELPADLCIFEGAHRTGYRNKMEFSFTTDDTGSLSLALNTRLTRRKIAIPGCALATGMLNEAANSVLDELNAQGVKEDSLKTMVVRASSTGQTAAAIFTMDESLAFDPLKVHNSHMAGVSLYYSDPALSASVPTRLIARSGTDVLTEELTAPGGRKVRLSTGLLNFFQVNIEAFEAAISDMAPFVKGREVVECFSGVGSISISLSPDLATAHLSDIDPGAIEHARENIEANGLSGRYEAVAESARKIREEITPERTVIFDPPRSGLEPKVIKRITETLPPRIVYLSCGPKTQADNVGDLIRDYDIIFAKLYNFFPRTPHIESLVVLERRK